MGKLVRRYWGYLALGLVILGWVTHTVAYAVVLILSVAALVYFLVQAPLTCGAEIRKGIIAGTTLMVYCWVAGFASINGKEPEMSLSPVSGKT